MVERIIELSVRHRWVVFGTVLATLRRLAEEHYSHARFSNDTRD